MKKPKLNLGPGGVQGMLAQHVEKFVLAVVVGLVGMFLYTGYSHEGYSKNPAELHTKAISAEGHVAADTSIVKITLEKRDVKEPYRERVQQSLRATAASEYSILPFNPSMFPPTSPRQDPELLAPLQVEAEGFLVAVHELVEDAEDPFVDDKNAGPLKKAPPPKKGAERKDDKKKTGGSSMPGMAPPGGAKSPSSKPGAMGSAKSGPGSSGMPMGPGMSGMGPPGMGGSDDPLGLGGENGKMGGMAGMSGAQAGASVSESYIKQYVHGYRPGGGMSSQTMPGNQKGVGGQSIGVSRYVIAVKAVVPHQKLVDEYRRVFADAQGYDLLRDTPRYVYYNVERSEVGADPDAEPEWQSIRVSAAWKNDMANWSGYLREVADSRYIDPVITQHMPPAMMVDPIRFGLHSEVPRELAVAATEEDDATNKTKARREKTKDDGGDDAPDPTRSPFAGGAGGMPGMAGGAGGIPGMPGVGGAGGIGAAGGGAGGMRPPGAGSGSSGMPGMAGGMPGMAGGMPGMSGGMPGMSGGMPGMSGGMPGMSGGMPGMSGGMPGMNYGAVGESVKYKLIRFYDFDVQPNKQYRYRVRVWVEDPNHPQTEDAAPSAKILSTKVSDRLKEIEDKEKANGKRMYYRITDWSEASSPVQVPSSIKFVAGQVRSGRAIEIKDLKMSVPIDEPSASVLPVVWDAKRAVDVPGFADAPDDPKNASEKEKPLTYRGTVFNFAKDARVLKPDSLEIRLIAKHPFRTNAVVVDLRPSEPVRDGDKKPGDKKEVLMTSGEVLIVDAEGNLIVRNELDDIEDFRKYMFVGEEKASGSGIPGMGGMGGMGGMMGGADGMAGADPANPASGLADKLGGAAGATKPKSKPPRTK